MRIIVMRHGDAIFCDNDRILSVVGQKEAKDSAQQLKSIVNIDRIICSPKTRAVQTASIVKDEIGYNGDLDFLSDLTPSGDVDRVIDYIDAVCSKDETVLLVSHLPLVEYLSYELVSMKQCSPSFSTACALVIDRNGRKADFKFFVKPFTDIEKF